MNPQTPFTTNDVMRFNEIVSRAATFSPLQKHLLEKAVGNDYVTTASILKAFGSVAIFHHVLSYITNAEVLRDNDVRHPSEVKFFKNPNCAAQIVALLAKEGKEWLETNSQAVLREEQQLRKADAEHATRSETADAPRPQIRDLNITAIPDISIKDVVAPKAKPDVQVSAPTSSFVVSPVGQLVKEMEGKPDLKSLCGTLIFENECAILFGDSNTGKSILAVQIGEKIADKFGMTVIYFDFELSTRQFCKRFKADHKFPENFIRAELSNEGVDCKNETEYEERVIADIENIIKESGAKMAIIDNLSYLCSQAEFAAEAGRFMKRLIDIKRRYELTLLVVGHTPKRQFSDPLTQNSLAGSKRLANFADSLIAVNKSSRQDKIHYIKHIKCRSADILYGDDNVILGSLDFEDGALRFVRCGFGKERDHLAMRSSGQKGPDPEILRRVGELRMQGYSVRTISEQIGVPKSSVQRYIDIINEQQPQLTADDAPMPNAS